MKTKNVNIHSQEYMETMAQFMEYGATIHHPNGATIIIPAHPFLHPVMEQHWEEIRENYRKALRRLRL